jgi:acyl carrier protein
LTAVTQRGNENSKNDESDGGSVTAQQAFAWIANIFEAPVEGINLETTSDDIEAWDSLGVLNLMAALDEEFGIQLEDEEVENLKTVKDVLNVLRRYGKLEATV